MLKIMHEINELDFSQLLDVYEQSILQSAARDYSHLSPNEGYLYARQDFYHYLKACFFQNPESFYAVWAPQGRYKAALRLEAYRDGLLLESLETAPEERRKGYASALMVATLDYLRKSKFKTVYSHVGKQNAASLAVHKASGFIKAAQYAAFIDGSVSYDCCTFCLHLKENGTD